MKHKPFKAFATDGAYPVKQVIFVNVDSVLGPLLNSCLFKPTYGRIDIIHAIRIEAKDDVDYLLSDVDILMLTQQPVVSSCWNIQRALKAIPGYLKARGWVDEDVRVYCLGWWINGKKFKRP